MTQSLPGQATPVGPPRDTVHERSQRTADRLLTSHSADTRTASNGLMLGGRSVTIDGNTLDTTLQLMLVGMTAVGLEGLIASRDDRRCPDSAAES